MLFEGRQSALVDAFTHVISLNIAIRIKNVMQIAAGITAKGRKVFSIGDLKGLLQEAPASVANRVSSEILKSYFKWGI